MNSERKKQVRISGYILTGAFFGSRIFGGLPVLEAALYCVGFFAFIAVSQFFFGLNDIDMPSADERSGQASGKNQDEGFNEDAATAARKQAEDNGAEIRKALRDKY